MTYCSKCKTFHTVNVSRCHCGALMWGDISTGLVPLVGPNQTPTGFAFHKTLVKSPWKHVYMNDKGRYRLSGNRTCDTIARQLMVCTNNDFEHYDVLFDLPTNDLDALEISATREEWPSGQMYDPKGIRSAILTIRLHRELELVQADGIVNLFARTHSQQRVGDRHITVYLAHWIKTVGQRKFDEYRIERGYIAKSGSLYFHSTHSPSHAIAGVLRKAQARKDAAEIEKVLKQKAKNLLSIIPKSVKVSFKDSRAAGNCSTGTRMFAERHGLNVAKSYPLRDIVALEPNNPHVRTLVIHKLRKTSAVLWREHGA